MVQLGEKSDFSHGDMNKVTIAIDELRLRIGLVNISDTTVPFIERPDIGGRKPSHDVREI